MNKIIERKSKIQDAIDKENNENKKRVLERLSQTVTTNGEYYYSDVFKDEKELLSDKKFVKTCVRFNPEIYEYITPELQDDREILLTLAKSPIYYNAMELGDYGSYAICPLHKILNANSFYSKKDKNPIITDNRERINDEEIILEALKAELLSFDYCEIMEIEKRPIIRYKGLSTLNDIKNEKEIEFSEYSNLKSLSYATDEMMNNNKFQRKVMEIVFRWKESLKDKSELEYREEELSSLEAKSREYDEELRNMENNKEGQNIGEE